MKRCALPSAGAVLLLVLLPGVWSQVSEREGPLSGILGSHALEAQISIGTECELREDYREFNRRQVSPGNAITYVGGPYLICPDGLRIQADSAVVYEASGRSELIGNVRFRHPERELDARVADYFERDGRLYARGDVRFLDIEGGTEIEGDTLDFRESRAGRPEEQLTVWGERSWATLVPRTPEGGVAPQSYRVGADRLRFEGDDFFWGDGNVEIDRDDLQATSDSLAFDQVQGRIILTGNANVTRGEVVATGGIVNLALRDEQLESLRTRRDGRIETEDGLVLTGEDVLVRLTPDEEIESILAEGSEDVRATLTSEEIALLGHTIDIEGAQGEGRVVRATGSARGETTTSAPAVSLPEGNGTGGLAGTLDRNWIEGDEIVAYFSRLDPPFESVPEPDDPDDRGDPDAAPSDSEPPAAGASTRDEYRLDRLESTGNARTLYRQPPDDPDGDDDPDDPDDPDDSDDPDDPDADPDAFEEVIVDAETGEIIERNGACGWSISYILANRIVIFMDEGEVERVEAESGSVDGIQLDPVCGDPSPETDTTNTGGSGR